MKTNFGYACINSVLRKDRIFCSRSMIKRTFVSKGLTYASELGLKNCNDLSRLIQWNHENDIKVFRITSNLFPWLSEYNLNDLPDYNKICESLKNAGNLAKKYNQRLSFHPGNFNCLGSPRENVVINSIKDLNDHGEIMDLIGMPRTREAKINIHVGGAYGDKILTAKRWCKNWEKLDDSVKSRITLENDDKKSLFSTENIYSLITTKLNIPIVFDYHHYRIHPDKQAEREAFEMAYSTWKNVKPVCHYSESKSLHENIKCSIRAHSDYVVNYINTYGKFVDVVIEAKAKEQAVINYRNIHIKNSLILEDKF